jgi:hypothetical protein
VKHIHKKEGDEDPAKRVQANLTLCNNMKIEDFVIKQTLLIFHRLLAS